MKNTIRRRLVSGGAWAIAGKVLSSTTSLALLALLTRLLTVKEMSAYFLLFSVVAVSAICAQLGLDQTVVRIVARAMSQGMPGRARTAVYTVLRCGALGAFVMGGILFGGLGRWIAQSFFHSPVMTGVIIFASPWVVVAALQNLIAETFRSFHDIRLASIFTRSTSNVICVLGLGLIWILRQKATLPDVILVSILAGTATVLISGFVLKRKLQSFPDSDPLNNKELLTAAFPQLITNLALLLNTQVALWTLGALAPPEQTAIYGAASRLVVVVTMPMVIVNSVVSPMIAEMYVQKRYSELEVTLRTVATLAGIPAFIVLGGYFALGKYVLAFVYGSYYAQGAAVLALLSVGQLVNVCSGCCGLTLIMSGHHRTMMKITVLCGLLNAVAAILLTIIYGVIGAAAATAGTTILENILMTLSARNKAGVWTHARFSLILRQVQAR